MSPLRLHIFHTRHSKFRWVQVRRCTKENFYAHTDFEKLEGTLFMTVFWGCVNVWAPSPYPMKENYFKAWCTMKISAVNGYPGTHFWAITQAAKLWMGTRGNKREQEKLTEEEQEDHARGYRFPKLVYCVDCVHYFLVFIVYSSSK